MKPLDGLTIIEDEHIPPHILIARTRKEFVVGNLETGEVFSMPRADLDIFKCQPPKQFEMPPPRTLLQEYWDVIIKPPPFRMFNV